VHEAIERRAGRLCDLADRGVDIGPVWHGDRDQRRHAILDGNRRDDEVLAARAERGEQVSIGRVERGRVRACERAGAERGLREPGPLEPDRDRRQRRAPAAEARPCRGDVATDHEHRGPGRGHEARDRVDGLGRDVRAVDRAANRVERAGIRLDHGGRRRDGLLDNAGLDRCGTGIAERRDIRAPLGVRSGGCARDLAREQRFELVLQRERGDPLRARARRSLALGALGAKQAVRTRDRVEALELVADPQLRRDRRDQQLGVDVEAACDASLRGVVQRIDRRDDDTLARAQERDAAVKLREVGGEVLLELAVRLLEVLRERRGQRVLPAEHSRQRVEVHVAELAQHGAETPAPHHLEAQRFGDLSLVENFGCDEQLA
jgi:hypothetical protein